MRPICGLVGIGAIGSAIDSLLLQAGFDVIAFDIDPRRMEEHVAAGGLPGLSPRDVVERAPLCITSLATPGQFHAVMTGSEGISYAAAKGAIVADTSTLSLQDKLSARDSLSEAGITLLDCPVSGVAAKAREKQLSIFASGDRDACDRIAPVLDVISREHDYVGPFGQGTKFKYIANLLVVINTCAAAEAMALAIKSGLDPALVHKLIGAGAGGSNMWDVRGRHMVRGDYPSPSNAFTIASKDGVLISKFATDLEFPAPLFQAALQPYFQAIARGMDNRDTASLCELFLENAGASRNA